MIVDASALLAVALGESDMARFSAILDRSSPLRISAVNYLEAAIRVDRTEDPALIKALGDVLAAANVTVVPATLAHAELARDAYRRFGKGQHKASLNFGDCFAYALAMETGEPLLFKGGDFGQTDIRPAL